MNGNPKYGVEDCVKQLAYTIEGTRSGIIVTEKWIGPTDAIEDLTITWPAGKKFNGDARIPDTKLSGYVQSSVATKMESERSAWTVSTCTEGRSNNDDGGEGDEEDTLWAINTGEYTESITRYLSPRQAEAFAIWKDAPKDPKNPFTFTYNNIVYDMATLQGSDGKPFGTITSGGNEQLANLKKCAELYLSGVESWKAYYLQATRTKYGLTKYPKRGEARIGTIDNTPKEITSWTDVDWLYTGYQVQEVNKQNYTLTETWNGIWDDLGGWEKSLYDDDTRMEVFHINNN